MTDQQNKIFVYYGNHNFIEGIKDHFDILSEILDKKNIKLIFSKVLVPNQINMLIEEFKNPEMIKDVENIKRIYTKTKIIIICTEFITELNGMTTLNGYYGTTFFVNCVKFSSKYIRFKHIRKRRKSLGFLKKIKTKLKLYLPPIWKFLIYPLKLYWVVRYLLNKSRKPMAPYIPILRKYKIYRIFRDIILPFLDPKSYIRFMFSPIKSLKHFYDITLKGNDWFKNYYYALSMKLRYEGLNDIIYKADQILTFHPEINQQIKKHYDLESQCVYPMIQNYLNKFSHLLNKGSLKMVCTGNHTPYRLNKFYELQLFLDKNSTKIKLYLENYLSNDDFKKFDILLTIPQTENWNNSSPVRVWRAIRSGVLPASYKYHNDHEIEKISIFAGEKIHKINKNNKLISYNTYIKKYNNFAEEKNNEFTIKIKKLFY